MKQSFFGLCAAIVLISTSCNFSVGAKKDFGTGLTFKYNGFAVEEVILVGPDNKPMENNEVQLNTKIAVVAQGISNYVITEDKAFPGLMIKVTDKSGAEVVMTEDLFADTEGYSATDAAVIRGSLSIGAPMVSGETYHFKMRLWDKNKLDSEIVSEVDILVK